MRLTLLGTGSACATARRCSSGHLLEWSGGAALLDPSAGTWMRALKSGMDPAALRVVLLSHFHPDHTGDLPGLLFARRQTPGIDAPLVIAGPAGTDRLVKAVRELYAPWGDWLDDRVEIAGFPFERWGLKVDAQAADHSPEACCLRIGADGKTIGYSGDTGDCPGLRATLDGVDCALLECTSPVPARGHLCPDQCAAILRDTKPARALLIHLGPDVQTGMRRGADGLRVEL